MRLRDSKREHSKQALAIGAHPDDIEFSMAGTLLLLKQAGFSIHYLNIASGSCGSVRESTSRTRATRRKEARAAARLLGALYHASFVDDLEILYSLPLLRKVSAVVREIAPTILLTHSPQDYMEDHMNTCRLAVTAAFARGMPNFRTRPNTPATEQPIAIYHCLPHGLRDPLGRRIIPGAFVDTTSVHELKRAALATHKSQKAWLDHSQGMDSYLRAMDDFSREAGLVSGQFTHAEGWRRHLHLGFAPAGYNPLSEALGENYLVNTQYEMALEQGT